MNLKDSLRKCLDKRNKLTRKGAAACALPRCQYFEEMRFLHENTINLPTESNVSNNLNETPTYHVEIPQEVVTVPAKRKLSGSLPTSKTKRGLSTHQGEY